MEDIVISKETGFESDVAALGPKDVQGMLILSSNGGEVCLRFTSVDAIERIESAIHSLYYEALFDHELSLQEELEFYEKRVNRSHFSIIEDE